ncbi:MAG: TonB-dependent receptor [Bacteroidaceae bacterium]|nr:TonB-dependent receptor [Bacteroidaceae bacterium]
MAHITSKFLLFLFLFPCISLQAQEKPERPDTTMMREVSINGQRQRISYRLDRQRLDASQVLTAQGGTALDVLRAVPGVIIDADGSLSFRGSQEFLVYIDGKPSPLSGTEALQMIGAASIKDIEILTTPSAKYKTDGDVGIINIVTRRSETEGWDLAVNGTASTWGTLSLDTKINYRTGHHNIYVSGQGSDIHNKSQFQQEKVTASPDPSKGGGNGGSTEAVTSFADGTRFRDFRTFIGQGGYEFNNGWHLLTIDLQGGKTINPRGGDMMYKGEESQQFTPPLEKMEEAHDRYKLTKHLFQAAVDYTWKLNERGDEISISNRLRYDNFSEEYTESNMFDLNGARQEGTRGYETEHHWDCDGAASYKLHYRQTGTLELGYQYTTYSEHGDYRICYWDLPSQNFVWQDDLYAPFYYRRQTHSSYAQVNDRFGPWQFDAGLRIDHVRDDMDLPTITSRHKRYTELYPSAHLAYTTAKAGTFTLGYSRRTNRPGIWKLEPYITYEDYHTRIIGNPDLESEHIHSMELSWRKMISKTQVTATVYARRRTGVVDYVRRAYDVGVTLDSIINAGNGWRKGLELQVTTKPTRWWQLTANGDLSLHNFRATYEGCTSTHNTTGTIGCINNFRLAKNTSVQFDGHFVSGHHLTQGWETAYVYFDLAARQSLLKGKLQLGLVAHDIFHTARYHSLRTSTLMSSETWVRPTYPNIVLSVSYHFRQPSAKTKEGALSKEAEFVGKDF